jgi:predicted Zn finger-like uncharacterized protein
MILSCNSCEKKFVVPDQAITPAGRVVQCGSCGNKWKQFPIKSEIKKVIKEKNIEIKKTSSIKKTSKPKKTRIKKTREVDLYSSEYLKKKHGITLNEETKKPLANEKISFGFYNSLLLFLVIIITLSRGLHFFQDFIITKLPFTEFYINYFFESIRNMFELWKNLISNY